MSSGSESQQPQKQLKKVFLGGAGMKVSELCLGAVCFFPIRQKLKSYYRDLMLTPFFADDIWSGQRRF
jgi:hypothetical protein